MSSHGVLVLHDSVLTWEDVDVASYSALSKYLNLLTGSDDTTVPPLTATDTKNVVTRFRFLCSNEVP